MIKKVKFVLIKEYPGSPSLGTEREIEVYDGHIRTNKSWELIHLYPEFWEKIEEKDFEILSYYMPGFYKDSTHHVKKAGFFRNTQFGGNSEWHIYSVKRVSDGEIFTIGDSIKYYHTNDKYPKKIISISFGKDLKLYFRSQDSLGNSETTINNLEHIKKPKLFTTIDGKDIYEGDKWWFIHLYENPGLGNGKTWISQESTGIKLNLCNVAIKRFSTKEKAEEYVLMNKPCLSINDVMGAGYGICNSRSLEDIVKSKLNG